MNNLSTQSEDPHVRSRRLAWELADVLNVAYQGECCVYVYPSQRERFAVAFMNLKSLEYESTPLESARQSALKLVKAISALNDVGVHVTVNDIITWATTKPRSPIAN